MLPQQRTALHLGANLDARQKGAREFPEQGIRVRGRRLEALPPDRGKVRSGACRQVASGKVEEPVLRKGLPDAGRGRGVCGGAGASLAYFACA